MEIELEVSKKDYTDFYKYYYFQRNLIWKIVVIILLDILISYNLTYRDSLFLKSFLTVFFITGLILFVITFLAPYLISILNFRNSLKRNKIILGDQKMSLLNNGIIIETKTEATFFEWKDFKSIHVNHCYIYIHLYNNRVYLIPTGFFVSNTEVVNFLEFIQFEIFKKSKKNARHIYKWGWLGLIPNIGLIIGVIFIFRSIFQYKDKKLFLIGVADILFTIGFWFVFLYQTQYGSWFTKSIAQNSQIELNSCAKEIELYKAKNGIYPESLRQLFTVVKSPSIDDPLLLRNSKNLNTEFNYRKTDDKYILFSSGIDGIPNTSDDIYPH